MKLQATISKIEEWAKKWRIKINQSKSTHITFTLRNKTCPTMQVSNVALPPFTPKRSEIPRHASR
jgi:hypothetical protein